MNQRLQPTPPTGKPVPRKRKRRTARRMVSKKPVARTQADLRADARERHVALCEIIQRASEDLDKRVEFEGHYWGPALPLDKWAENTSLKLRT